MLCGDLNGKEIQKRGDICIWASQMVLVVKNQSANAGDIREVSSIPGSDRSGGYSVDQHIRHLKGYRGWGPAL